MMGLEPTTAWTTTKCYHQLSYIHHITILLLLIFLFIPVDLAFGKRKYREHPGIK